MAGRGRISYSFPGLSWVENCLPAWFYAHLVVRFARDRIMAAMDLRRMLADHGFSIANLHYWLDRDAGFFEYRMVIGTHRSANARRLKETLNRLESVKEYQISMRPEVQLRGKFR